MSAPSDQSSKRVGRPTCCARNSHSSVCLRSGSGPDANAVARARNVWSNGFSRDDPSARRYRFGTKGVSLYGSPLNHLGCATGHAAESSRIATTNSSTLWIIPAAPWARLASGIKLPENYNNPMTGKCRQQPTTGDMTRRWRTERALELARSSLIGRKTVQCGNERWTR